MLSAKPHNLSPIIPMFSACCLMFLTLSNPFNALTDELNKTHKIAQINQSDEKLFSYLSISPFSTGIQVAINDVKR